MVVLIFLLVYAWCVYPLKFHIFDVGECNQIQKAFSFLQLVDKNYKFCPTSFEWTRGEKIFEFLESFYETTNLIFDSSYPTSNLYFMQVWKIECLLLENERNEDVVISEMCKRMKDEFDNCWSQYSVALAFGAVLDPRIKLTMLEYFYSKIDASKAKDMVKKVRTKLNELFEQYANSTMHQVVLSNLHPYHMHICQC